MLTWVAMCGRVKMLAWVAMCGRVKMLACRTMCRRVKMLACKAMCLRLKMLTCGAMCTKVKMHARGDMCGKLVLYRAHIARISFLLHTPSLGTKLPCLLLAFDPVGNEADCLRVSILVRLLALEINWIFFFTICLRLACVEDLGFSELGTLVFPDFLTYHLQRNPSSEQV